MSAYETSAADMLDLIDQLRLVQPGDQVLDIGCGTGVRVPGLLSRAGAGAGYVGFDVNPNALRWCQGRYGPDPR
ncbi:MAG: methyltransferase domain-containing protein [Thermoanaerobaculia bacterium]